MFSSIPDLTIWLARQQKFIVKAYPIDGHICTVMNPIQWRDKWRGHWEVPGQRGSIKHISIVLNTIDMTGCRQNSLEVLHVSRGLLSLQHNPPPSTPCCCLQTDTIPVSSLRTSEDTGISLARGVRGCSADRWCCQPEKVCWLLGSVTATSGSLCDTFCALKVKIITPSSGSQIHRQTWKLLVAWGQREYF